MSNPVGAQRYGLGGGDAYYDAVKYGGYTGTREQFGRDQAEFAQNATAVAQAKEEVERNTQTVVNTAQTFTEETVPAAIQSVEEKGDTEEDRLEARTTELVQSINTAGAVQVQAVEDEGTEQIGLVSGAGTAQVEAVEQAGSDQVDAVEAAGSTQVESVNDAGTTQVGNVNQAGTTQVGNVNTAGAAQVQAVQAKGTEVINSIPADYTELSEEVDEQSKVVFPKNIAGFITGIYYEINPPIKAGEKFVVATNDGETIRAWAEFEWCDSEKTRIGSQRFYADNAKRTVTVSNSDMYYFRWLTQPRKIMRISRETELNSYSPTFQPIDTYAPFLGDAEDYHKQKINYPDSFVYPIYSNHNTGLITGSDNYRSTDLIHLVAGDILHYALCTFASENIITIIELDGSYNSELSVSGADQNTIKSGTLTIDHECYAYASHRNNNVSNQKKYFYINDSIFEKLKTTVTEDDVVENTSISGYGTLSGWEDHAVAFSKMMADVNDTEGFLYFTDAHFMSKTGDSWKEYLYEIMSYLEKLYYSSPCSFVLHGGDWLGTGEARLDFLYKLSAIGGSFRRNFDRFALLVGNHETGNQSAEGTMFTHDTLAATLLSNVGKTYYKFMANTFTMYCFDSWQSGAIDSFAKEQIAWFANSLTTEKANHIVIAIHMLHNTGVTQIGEQITLCADAYNNRTTYTYDGITYDYTNATGKVAFAIAGHTHSDAVGTQNGIPYIETRNFTGYSETTFANLPLPLDLIKVDWNNALLTAYRAARGAAGTTRTLNIIAN